MRTLGGDKKNPPTKKKRRDDVGVYVSVEKVGTGSLSEISPQTLTKTTKLSKKGNVNLRFDKKQKVKTTCTPNPHYKEL